MEIHSFILFPAPQLCGEEILKTHRVFLFSYPGIDTNMVDIVAVNCDSVTSIPDCVAKAAKEYTEHKALTPENLKIATYGQICSNLFALSPRGETLPPPVVSMLSGKGLTFTTSNCFYLCGHAGIWRETKHTVEAEMRYYQLKRQLS